MPKVYCVQVWHYDERYCYHYRTKEGAEKEYRRQMIEMLWLQTPRRKKDYLNTLTTEELIEQLAKDKNSAVDMSEMDFHD